MWVMKSTVVYKNTKFIGGLVLTLALLLLCNAYNLIFYRDSWAVVPLILQGTILLLIILKSKYQKGLIKFWALLLIVAGCAGVLSFAFDVLSTFLRDGALEQPDWTLMDSTIKLCFGVAYFWLTDKHIEARSSVG